MDFVPSPSRRYAAWRCADFDHFAAALTEAGAVIDYLPAENGLTLDSLYLLDAAIVAPGGIVLGNMGRRHAARRPPLLAIADAALVGARF